MGALGGRVALVRQQGRLAACLRPTAMWVVGEVGSLRSPERRLRTVGTAATFRRVSLCGCLCVALGVWAASWLTRVASDMRVWLSLPLRLFQASFASILGRPWLMDLVGGGLVPSESSARPCRCW